MSETPNTASWAKESENGGVKKKKKRNFKLIDGWKRQINNARRCYRPQVGYIFHLTVIELLKSEIFFTRANRNEQPKQRPAIVSKFHERPAAQRGCNINYKRVTNNYAARISALPVAGPEFVEYLPIPRNRKNGKRLAEYHFIAFRATYSFHHHHPANSVTFRALSATFPFASTSRCNASHWTLLNRFLDIFIIIKKVAFYCVDFKLSSSFCIIPG